MLVSGIVESVDDIEWLEIVYLEVALWNDLSSIVRMIEVYGSKGYQD